MSWCLLNCVSAGTFESEQLFFRVKLASFLIAAYCIELLYFMAEKSVQNCESCTLSWFVDNEKVVRVQTTFLLLHIKATKNVSLVIYFLLILLSCLIFFPSFFAHNNVAILYRKKTFIKCFFYDFFLAIVVRL